jgi:NAD(P)-dependent dehydrogenase (short-subunit alcohol dehydrogenase family)
MSMGKMFDLTGKTVLVTGGNSGLGLGFAEGCARNGADIVVWGRRAEQNAQAADHLRALGAPRVETATVDVADESQVIEGFAEAVASMGRVDCVFANAGRSVVAPSFPDMTSADYHDLLAVNQHGAFYTLREACRHMRARAEGGDPGGSLVICGSLSIFGGTKGIEHYAAAKGALAAMLKGIAVEMGPYAVRANMIAFGYFQTEMTQVADPAITQMMAAKAPLGRVGTLADVHGIAAFLTSDESSFLTGEIIALDGGRTATSR